MPNLKTDYKVGDKVRFIKREEGDDRPYVKVGEVYTVAELGGFPMDLWLKVDGAGPGQAGMYFHEVEPA